MTTMSTVCLCWALLAVAIVKSSSLLDPLTDEEQAAILKRLEENKEDIELMKNDNDAMLLKIGELARKAELSEEDRPIALSRRLSELKQEIRIMKKGKFGGWSTYVRWGRKTCPKNGTELVYSGFVAGADRTHGGTGATVLCMTDEPIYDVFETKLQNGAMIYGGEYQLDQRTHQDFVGKDVKNHDIPCAVCRAPRSSALMIPGRNQCQGDDWIKEYAGYLVGGYYNQAAATEILCLDRDVEILQGGHEDHNGKLFYMAEGRCGSLPCGPYEDGKELTCVVCSK